MSVITDVNDDSLALLTSEGVCVVKFGAEWCKPCKALKPIFESVASTDSSGTKFIEVDVDECAGFASAFNIRSVPTVVFLVGGNEHWRRVGVIGKSELAELIRLT